MNLGGAISGAISGGSAGSILGGGGGALIGGAVGGIAGLFGKKKKKTLSTLDAKQKKLNDYQHQAVLGEGPLADLYNYDPEEANSVFDQTIANPAYRQFNEQLAPGITGQFRSQGLMNSSYAGDALSKLARDIQENLNSQRSQYLYGEQKDARNAKRTAVDSLQGRQTFGYNTANSGGLDSILKTFTPSVLSGVNDIFGRGTPTQMMRT